MAGDASLGSARKDRKVVKHNAQDGGGTSSDLSQVFNWESIARTRPHCRPRARRPGDDTIGLGLGTNKAVGNSGSDKIGVAADQPDGARRPGSTRSSATAATTGSPAARTRTGSSPRPKSEFGVDEPGPADTVGADPATNTVDTGTGSDKVWGSQGFETVTSHSLGDQTATSWSAVAAGTS